MVINPRFFVRKPSCIREDESKSMMLLSLNVVNGRYITSGLVILQLDTVIRAVGNRLVRKGV